jgi:hypothetical protein
MLTIRDEQIRQASSARRLDTVNQFEVTMQRYDEAQKSVVPLIGYLRDIRTSLGTDLTPGGVQAAKASAKTASDNAAKARASLAKSASEMDELTTNLSAIAPEAPKATAAK